MKHPVLFFAFVFYMSACPVFSQSLRFSFNTYVDKGDASKASSIVHIPIWIVHGAEDPAVNPLYSLDMLQALTKAGAHPGFTQYPEVGHFSWLGHTATPLIMEWLFRQHK